MRRHAKRLLILVALAAAWPVGTSEAGPAHYDKATKSFRFAYTFADLPGGVGSVVGTVRKPTPEQEATVKGLVGKVSDVLSLVTGGRAKIGSLDYVDDIKNADLVISLVGKPASPGWANLRATEGQPGQIVLYYQSLDGKLTQDVVYTAAHEICHYIFGLADEYDPNNFPGGCPRGGGPGCLMDNYNAGARGFMGRLCLASDHNTEPTQRPSCRDIVEKFFNDRGVTADDPTGAAGALAGSGDTTPKPDPRTEVIASAISQVRAKRTEQLAEGKTSTTSLRTIARDILGDLITRHNRDNPNKVILSASNAKVVDMIAKAGEFVPLLRPTGLDPKAFDLIKAEAEKLGREAQDVKTPSSRASKIRTGLQQFVRELAKLDQLDPKSFAPADQRKLIDQLARDAARDPKDRQLDRLVGVGDQTARLELAAAEDIVRVLDALGEPGTRQRLEFVNRIRGELTSSFGIIGRDSTQFGFRRTRIITPDPIDGDIPVLTQGGVFPYSTIRDRSTVQFSRLVRRAKIQLVTPSSQRGADFQPLASRIELPFDKIPSEDRSSGVANRVSIQETLADTIDQLERDRLENIAVLIPPGGLPGFVSEQIPAIKSRLQSGQRVRLDLVVVGVEEVGTELRDAAVKSRGSVLTVTDVDEIGSIAQRLKNDQSSGSWVIVPQQGNFAFDQNKLVSNAPFANPDPLPQAQDSVAAKVTSLETDGFANPANPNEKTKPETLRDGLDGLSEQLKACSAGVEGNVDDLDPSARLARSLRIDVEGLRAGLFGPSAGNSNQPQAEGTAAPAAAAAATERSLSGQLPAWAKQVDDRTNERSTLRANDPNITILLAIAQARKDLGKVRAGLSDALQSPRSDAIALQLRTIAGAAATAQQPPAPPKPGATPPANDAAKPEDDVAKMKALGADLVRIEQLIGEYEKLLELAYLKSGGYLPIYRRVDRFTIERKRLQLEMAAIQKTTGIVAPAVNAGVGPDQVRLARFYAEGDAEFELVLGLSRELPKKGGVRTHPHLQLLSDAGLPVAEAAKVTPDETTSTPSLLVWRAATPPLAPGWYTPVVTFDQEVMDQLKQERVNFTFSVGSNRPNIQLITGLVQPPETNASGTIVRADGPAVVEVQVSAGSSVLGASITGFLQAMPRGIDPIVFQAIQFRDDGHDANGLAPANPAFDPRHCDRSANDGIYTSFIPLQGVSVPTEYRVFVQADTTAGTARYIGLDDPNRGDQKPTMSDRKPSDEAARNLLRQSTESAEGTALPFQRATTVHFVVKP